MADKKFQDRFRIKRKREDEVRREAEQRGNSERRRQARKDEERRDAEKLADSEKRRQARTDEERRDAEQQANSERRRQARKDEERRDAEQELNSASRKRQRTEHTSSFKKAFEIFRARNKEGPVHICACCGGIFFQKSVTTTTRETLVKFGCTEKFLDQIIAVKPAEDNSIVLCSTCRDNILKSKVPKRCLANGLAFPDRPEVLQGLSLLEEILISARCAFMMIRPLGWDGQYGLKGNIVNVPIDVSETEKILPRQISNSSVVHLALMRKLEYKNPYMYETIRPQKVYEACKFLVTTPVYKDEGITLSEDWKNINCPMSFQETELPILETATEDSDAMDVDSSDTSSDEAESDTIESFYPEQTMLMDDSEFLTHAVKHAPGEGQRPISLLWDLNAEVLTFPTIYCGQKRNVNPKLTYSDIAKSEALNYDRRSCVPNKLLYMFKKSQLQQVVDSITISLRKGSKTGEVTAGNLLDPDYVTRLEHRNEGYKILKNIRSSPAYWEARKKELFATIRQLGIPTFFHTVAATEIQWPELLVILKQILDGKTITEVEAEAMSQEEKNKLVRRDPITCSRYFDAKTQDYFNIMLKSKAVFTEHPLEDYFMRVEFQHRGSPHLHIFLWLKNAPNYTSSDPESCISFIDQYITTAKTELSARYQKHRHTHCCRRIVNNVNICRFGIPYPPMKKTQILTPLAPEFPEGERVLLKNDLSKVKARLKEFEDKDLPNIPYEEFLEDVQLTEDRYILAIRANLRRPTIVLKREVESAFINGYNEMLLMAWRSNMDLQFVLDPYACAKYLSEYISKSYRGMSTLLRKTMTELKRGNQSLKTQLKSIGSVFVNKSEVAAQEAAYGILGLPLSKFSRDHIYVNTGIPEERSRLTKSKDELKQMDPGDTNVIVDGLLEHYTNRSDDLENLCLADYAALYNFNKSKDSQNNKSAGSSAETPLLEYKFIMQRNGNGYVKRRKFPKVIRSRRYGQIKEPYMFCREQLMLYIPWRNEESDLNNDPMSKYLIHYEAIKEKSKEYNKTSSEISIEEACEQCEAEDAPTNSEIQDEENHGVGPTDQNIFDDKKDGNNQRFLLPGILPQSEYEDLMGSLNCKQKNYLLHVIHAIKSKKQILEYLGGGAGVGKSTTIRAIVQALTRFFLSKPGSRPDVLRVLLCAPTGIAAYNIQGKTIHSSFVIPFNQSSSKFNQYIPLDPSTRTKISSKLLGVKLIICDELSMVSSFQLEFINLRLQEYFNSKEPFGGHSLILVGDLWQLPPVIGSAIFRPIENNISYLAGSSIWDKFRFYELEEVMRQQGDPAFAQALNRMKIGKMTESDLLLLKSRQISAFNQPPDGVIWLFHFNKKVDEHNEAAIARCKVPGISSSATDKIEGKENLDEQGQEKILGDAKKLNYQKAQGLPGELILKPSLRYMVTMNIPNSDLANGAIGILRHVSTNVVTNTTGSITVPSIVWLEFPEERMGAETRQSFRGYRPACVNPSWTPICMESKLIISWPGKHARVVRTQFPLTPAEAITIYKSQSQTFLQMVLTVHLGITRTLLYVGCSRARSSNGLWINGTFKAPKPVDPTNKVYQAYQDLQRRPVLLSHLPTPAPREKMLSIVFYNIEHFEPHKNDLKTILDTMQPTIVTLVETHTWPNQHFESSDYHLLQRSDQNEEKTAGYGTACLSKSGEGKSSQSLIVSCKKGHVQLEVITLPYFVLVYGYAAPKTTFSDVHSAIDLVFKTRRLSPTSTIVMGDFNMDLNTVAGTKLRELMTSLGMPSCLPTICSTTKSGTQIDCVFSGVPGVEAYISTSLSSHHDPIQVFVPAAKNTELAEDHDLLKDLTQLTISTNDEEDITLPVAETSTYEVEPTTQFENLNLEEASKTSMPYQVRFKNQDQLHRGLQNPPGRNLCFVNSSIQALKPIFDILKDPQLTEACLYSNLLKLYNDMNQLPSTQIVTELLSGLDSAELRNGDQHDAAEFLDKLLEQLHEDAVLYSTQPDRIESNFRIVISDNERGVACSHRRREIRSQWSLPLPLSITDAKEDVNSLLQKMLKNVQSVPKSCQHCRTMHCVLDSCSLEVLPHVLLLQLGRFPQKDAKLEKFVGIPGNLQLKDRSKTSNYQLKSIIQHIGTSNGGHYITAVKDASQNWVCFDDERTSSICESEAISENAYIVIYTRI